MGISLDDLDDMTGRARWWRYRGEWADGWADYELEWIRQGRPAPEHWEYHRAGTQWEHVTYFQVRECYAEGHPNTNMFVWISQHSGHRIVVETCEDCGEKIGGAVGTRRLATLGLNRNNLPCANSGVETHEVCARCGSDDSVELHHWAPRHLFDDADNWPFDYLCRACHQKWHRVVTPSMNARKPKAKPVSQWLTDLANREAAS